MIKDDGVGIANGQAARGGMGLESMDFRANAVGASLVVEPSPHGGTLVKCSKIVGKKEIHEN